MLRRRVCNHCGPTLTERSANAYRTITEELYQFATSILQMQKKCKKNLYMSEKNCNFAPLLGDVMKVLFYHRVFYISTFCVEGMSALL